MRIFILGHWPTAIIALLAVTTLAVPSATAQMPMSPPTNVLQTGFETFTPGPLLDGRDDSGRWTADELHANIHTSHRRSGKASLRLLGGANREVTWTLNSISGKAERLEFWFERWTSRSPFDFQVDLLIEDQWKTAYSNSGKASVGGFKNLVSIPLDGRSPSQVRFRSTTPNDSGVMIDDLVIEENSAKHVASVTCRQRTLPVLLRNEWNPILDLTIDVQGNQGSLTLNEVTVDLSGSLPPSFVERVDVIAATSSNTAWYNIVDLSKQETLSLFGSAISPSTRMALSGTAPLDRGDNHFLVSIKLKDSVDISQTLQIDCPSVSIAGNKYKPIASDKTNPLRIGHALRRAGDDGVDTYRIPGLATTTTGSLIAVYDVRYRSGGDLPGDIDIGMSRSVNGGLTWEPMQIIINMGDDPQWKFDGIGDPAILVDSKHGTIWVAALWSHGDRAWHRSGQGISPEQTGQFILVRSDDDGQTWSEPINITNQIKKPEWNLLFNGPGKGICMEDGTLVFAAQYQDEKRVPHSTIVFSKDHGQTWQVGTGAHPETTEAQVVEVRQGVLMLNCRYNNSPTRVVMTTNDLGATWEEHPSSKKRLIEPAACMASLIDVDQELGQSYGGWLLFSNPDSQSARRDITIKASSDGGNSWPQEYRLLLDEGVGAGYSCMTMIDRHTVGILYEGSTSKLVFQRVPLKEIIRILPDGHDSGAPNK